MKTLKTFAFALAFATCSLSFAESNPEDKVQPESIGQVVADLLKSPDVDLTSDKSAVIEFSINEKNEIIVSSVDTDNYFLKRFIKFRLNFEKVSEEIVKDKNSYRILISFTELN